MTVDGELSSYGDTFDAADWAETFATASEAIRAALPTGVMWEITQVGESSLDVATKIPLTDDQRQRVMEAARPLTAVPLTFSELPS